MVFEYTIAENEFDLESYPPLKVANYLETFDPVPFDIDITFSYYSTLFYNTTTVRIVMTGEITQYKIPSLGWYAHYPSVSLVLGGNVGGEGYAGIRVMIDGCCVVDNFSGYTIVNGVQTSLEHAEYYGTFSGAYTSDGQFTIDKCTLPIVFECATQDELDNEYMFLLTNGAYDIPLVLCFQDYSPVSPTKYLTTQLCEEHIINFAGGEFEPEGRDFEIKNSWTFGEWTKYGQPPVRYVNWRCLRGRITSGRMCLYPIAGINEGSLKYQIVSDAVFYALETSTDGNTWTPLEQDTLPFDFFYRPRVNELGEFNYGLTFANDTIPIFKDETDADDYIDEELNEIDAENWDEISDKYPDPQISIGNPDTDPTTMGEVFTRAFFSQQYICSAGAMSEIAGALFDTTPNGVWEDIKKGLEMYGDSPVDDIQGCMFFPFSLSNVFTNTQNQNYIYFGGYKFDLQSHTVDKIIYPNGYIDFGSWTCPYRFGGSFRDYAPYRRLTVYLPYIGWAELDIKRYIGKSVNVKYYIDTRTGGCMACLFAGGILYDYFQGQMGISMPITATDFVAYANAQIQTLLGGAGAMKNNAGTLVNQGAGMVAQGATAGAVAMGLAPMAGLAVGAGVAKTMYGLTQNNINNFNVTKGASSSMLNAYLPQNVMFLDEVQKGTPTKNELSLMGYPSNASGALQNFSGYLEVDAVNLECDTATDNERAEIMAFLRSGVYI